MKNPCKSYCEHRHAECHFDGSCPHGYEEWAKWKEEMREKRAKENKVRKDTHELNTWNYKRGKTVGRL